MIAAMPATESAMKQQRQTKEYRELLSRMWPDQTPEDHEAVKRWHQAMRRAR